MYQGHLTLVQFRPAGNNQPGIGFAGAHQTMGSIAVLIVTITRIASLDTQNLYNTQQLNMQPQVGE